LAVNIRVPAAALDDATELDTLTELLALLLSDELTLATRLDELIDELNTELLTLELLIALLELIADLTLLDANKELRLLEVEVRTPTAELN
jgi:hypothetical protein